jgi:hypothetical protein
MPALVKIFLKKSTRVNLHFAVQDWPELAPAEQKSRRHVCIDEAVSRGRIDTEEEFLYIK